MGAFFFCVADSGQMWAKAEKKWGKGGCGFLNCCIVSPTTNPWCLCGLTAGNMGGKAGASRFFRF